MALSTSRPKLEIDGRPISRLLSGLTPSAHPLSQSSLALPLPHPTPPTGRPPVRLWLVKPGCSVQGLAAGHAGPDREMVGSMLQLTQTEVPTCWVPHQTDICSAMVGGVEKTFENEVCSQNTDKRHITAGRRDAVSKRRVAYWMDRKLAQGNESGAINSRAAGLHHGQNQFSFQFFRSLIYKVFLNIILFTEASDSI